ncbi:MAG: transcriptional regulator [Deltaproteobacteria bacterium]|nr:transcriptional regulator [Deltaproteobacteria bacterium]
MTARESQIYTAIHDFITVNGYPPTFREIGSLVGLKSSSAVHYYLQKIRDKGHISYHPGKSRTLRVIQDD